MNVLSLYHHYKGTCAGLIFNNALNGVKTGTTPSPFMYRSIHNPRHAVLVIFSYFLLLLHFTVFIFGVKLDQSFISYTFIIKSKNVAQT